MPSGPFHAVKVEFARPFLARRERPAAETSRTDYRELAARELSMLARAPLVGRRKKRGFGPIPPLR